MVDSSTHSLKPLRPFLGTIFLTCCLDIVGLTLVIPLLPFLLDYYLTVPVGESPSWLQGLAIRFMGASAGAGGVELSLQGSLLMSGLFALLYSLCQFFSAPIWGRLSDRFGRKGVLRWTVVGAALAQLIWVFGDSIEAFLLMRAIAGMMAGNMSVATAAIADVTPGEKRARAMTTIGLAYGIGYMVGPFLGGVTGGWNLLDIWPWGEPLGMHPFSGTAMTAFILTLGNLLMIQLVLPETLQQVHRDRSVRISLGLFSSLLKAAPRPELGRIFWANCFFFLVFTGCEFNLVFLAFERFGFGPLENAIMFLLIGFFQIVAQFFCLPQILKVYDERQVSVGGFMGLMAGVLLAAFSYHPWVLYGSCVVMSFGASIVFPCLSSMVSRFATPQTQGMMLGLHRSRGDVGTAIGPLTQSVLFSFYGSVVAFGFYGLLVLAPILFILRVVPPTSAKVAVPVPGNR